MRLFDCQKQVKGCGILGSAGRLELPDSLSLSKVLSQTEDQTKRLTGRFALGSISGNVDMARCW